MTPAALCISTFLGTLLGSFLPIGSTELIVLSAATLAPPSLLIPLALIAALAQMVAKSVLYFAGRVIRFTVLVALPHALKSAL